MTYLIYPEQLIAPKFKIEYARVARSDGKLDNLTNQWLSLAHAIQAVAKANASYELVLFQVNEL